MQPSDEQAFKLKDMARSALETGLAFGMDERVFERLALAVWAEAQQTAVPLTHGQIAHMMLKLNSEAHKTETSLEMFRIIVREVERAHGITTKESGDGR